MAFDPNLCQQYVEMLVDHDEVERALIVLENVPAYYRDAVPQNLAKLKKDILQAICTSHAYYSDNLDQKISLEAAKYALQNIRGLLIAKEVETYNKQGLTPHIVDMGPGEYFVPIGLKDLKLKFTYNDIGLDQQTRKDALPFIEDVKRLIPTREQPVIFLALEIIEHLHNPKDIVTECLRHCGEFPERVHLSTPCYTYDASAKDWRKKSGLPHLRAYTPAEFMRTSQSLFREYAPQYFDGIIMSIRLQRSDKIDPNQIL